MKYLKENVPNRGTSKQKGKQANKQKMKETESWLFEKTNKQSSGILIKEKR